MVRLGVNIDHIATIRNARGEDFPSVLEAGLIAETNGADLITVHLREDRRHIKDKDVFLLRQALKTELNLEMAVTSEMVEFALKVKPDYVCLVPEKRTELTTEGGLNLLNNTNNIANAINILKKNGIIVSLFIDPDDAQVSLAHDLGANAIEIHTGKYARLKRDYVTSDEFLKIKNVCEYAKSIGLVVNAGHGLNYHNVAPIASLPQINELNIGFAIISQSLFWGFAESVSRMKQLILDAKR